MSPHYSDYFFLCFNLSSIWNFPPDGYPVVWILLIERSSFTYRFLNFFKKSHMKFLKVYLGLFLEFLFCSVDLSTHVPALFLILWYLSIVDRSDSPFFFFLEFHVSSCLIFSFSTWILKSPCLISKHHLEFNGTTLKLQINREELKPFRGRVFWEHGVPRHLFSCSSESFRSISTFLHKDLAVLMKYIPGHFILFIAVVSGAFHMSNKLWLVYIKYIDICNFVPSFLTEFFFFL